MRIDFHCHCTSTDEATVRSFAELCKETGTIACLCSIGPRCSKRCCTNNEVMEVTRMFPDRFIPFAFVDLWKDVDSGCVDAFAEEGFKGLKCITPYYPYDHDIYMPVYERAEKHGLPMLFHTGAFRPNAGDVRDRRPVLRNMEPIAIDRIARSFPKLRIVMAHLGSTFFRREAAEMVRLHPNVYTDLAGNGSWLGLGPEELTDLLANPVRETDTSFDGFRKLVFGSDSYTDNTASFVPAQRCHEYLLERVGVPGEIRMEIMGGTAASWLDL